MSQNSIIMPGSPLTGTGLVSAVDGAFDSLATDFSGASEPGTTWALMKWADLTNNILKIRNLTNDGWINFMDLTTGEVFNAANVKTSVSSLVVNNWTGRTAAEANSWYAVCWSTELGLFVVVGASGTYRVMTSPDGITWTGRTAAEANSWISVCWSAELGLFVAVGADGTHRIMTSPDGITWTARTAAEANFWRSVCWSAELGLFVAVGADGTHRIMTSPDGITWTARTAAEANFWISVCWSAELGLFVAIANNTGTHQVMTSLIYN
jgi:hypothetical protein